MHKQWLGYIRISFLKTKQVEIMFAKITLTFFTCLAFCQAVQFEIHNYAGGQIGVGITGNPGKGDLGGSFTLQQGQKKTLNVPDGWAGRLWSKTWCDGAGKNCETGDCGNQGCIPASLVELTLGGWGGLDYYDLSLVDAFNLKSSIEPIGGQGDGGQYSCKKANCNFDINTVCPKELQIVSAKGHGVLGCKSACQAFNTDQYCCRNQYGTPDKCQSKDWPHNYPYNVFKKNCPDAYSYAYDDHKSTYTCKNVKTYKITFG